jgi:large subunit ribosomal protein L17
MSHRKALLRNLATSFFKHERFETTVPKAKELRPVVERLVTIAKNDTLAGRRQAYSYLLDKAVVHKLFAEIGPRNTARNGGYTRIVRTRVRPGDAAEMAIIELVDKAEA